MKTGVGLEDNTQKKTVSLPPFPKEKEFEEYIAAHFQADGYFVESNIIYREEEELLEIDLLVTRYKKGFEPKKKLIEIKSGSWGFGDVFKIKGWMSFLKEYKKAILIVKESKTDKAFSYYQKIANSLGIKIVCVTNENRAQHDLKRIVRSTRYNALDVASWRFSNWVQRKIVTSLKKWKKQDIASKNGIIRHIKMDEYFYKVNCEVFFTENTLEKLEELYQVFLGAPKLASKCSAEMLGGVFLDDADKIDNSLFKKTVFDCDFNSIQVAFYLEHTLRLQIFKNAIEYIQYDEAGNSKKAAFESQGILGDRIARLAFLPTAYRSALLQIKKQPNYHLYPIFWSWFINVFGGIVLLDFKDKEYQLFSEKTGVPVGEIDTAIKAYEWLFPTPGGWLETYSNSSISMFKMFPAPLRGVGASYRRKIYSKTGDYAGIKLSDFSTKDLVKWNNCMVELLHESK